MLTQVLWLCRTQVKRLWTRRLHSSTRSDSSYLIWARSGLRSLPARYARPTTPNAFCFPLNVMRANHVSHKNDAPQAFEATRRLTCKHMIMILSTCTVFF